MVRHFLPDTGMVAGFSYIKTGNSGKRLLNGVQILDFISLISAAAGGMRMGRALSASGQNLSYRRKAFEEAGGFSRISHRISGDDVLLLQLIRKTGHWKIRFADPLETAVTTRPADTWTAPDPAADEMGLKQ